MCVDSWPHSTISPRKGNGDLWESEIQSYFLDGGRHCARQPLSFFNDEEVVGGNIRHGFELSIGPVNFDQVDSCLFVQAVVEAGVIGRKIAAAGANFIPLCELAADDLDARPDGVAVFAAPHKFDGDPVVVAS